MRNTSFVRRVTTLSFAAVSSVLGSVFFATSAFALVVRPVGDGSSPAAVPSTAPSTAHTIVTSGMAGWQITVIAVGAALLAASVAVVVDRTRTGHQGPRMSAA
jgi:ribosomal protein S11